MIPNFAKIEFNNRSLETLRQIYAVLYFMEEGAQYRDAIKKTVDYFPSVKDYQTIEDKCARKFAGYIGTFVEWYKWGKIIDKLTHKFINSFPPEIRSLYLIVVLLAYIHSLLDNTHKVNL